MWRIEKNLHAFPEDVNNFVIGSLSIYADLVILTFRMLSR